jgi:hypothetical protein
MKPEWHNQNNPMLGYKWEIQYKYGIIWITEDELFDRREFKHFTTHEYKVAYAMDMGWRFNIDNQMWYRISGY